MAPSAKWIEGIGPDSTVEDAARRSLEPRLSAVAHLLADGGAPRRARHRARTSPPRRHAAGRRRAQTVSRLLAAEKSPLGEEATPQDPPGRRRRPRPGCARRPAGPRLRRPRRAGHRTDRKRPSGSPAGDRSHRRPMPRQGPISSAKRPRSCNRFIDRKLSVRCDGATVISRLGR